MYGGGVFNQIFQNPQIQPFLPFFFTLAIVYGLLTLIGGRGEGLFGKKSVNFIISLVFAFFAAGYPPFVNFFFQYFGIILWFFIGAFFLAFFFEALGIGKGGEKIERGKENIPMIIAGLFIILLITVGIGFFENITIPYLNRRDFLLLVGLILLGIMVYFAYHHGRSRSAERQALEQQAGGG